jgi:hypothetical protein
MFAIRKIDNINTSHLEYETQMELYLNHKLQQFVVLTHWFEVDVVLN